MGMDYIPRRGDAASFHLNWWGHSEIARVLEQLGADLTEWSGSNDGDYITARTCRQWASTLRAGLAAGVIRQVSVPYRRHGPRIIPVVTGVEVEVGSLTHVLNVIYFGVDEVIAIGQAPTSEISAEMAAHINAFADFLDQCGGCRQW